VSLYDLQAYGPHTFFTTGFPRFLSIRGARGLQACAEFSKEATPEVTKEEPILEKLEQEHIKSRTTPSADFASSNETSKRSMSSAKPLREFEPMDWIPIDYGEVFDKRRPFPNQKGMVLTDKRRIPLRSASVRTPHLFHHEIPKVLVNPRSKGITSVRSIFTL
jgi:hypothetical protein